MNFNIVDWIILAVIAVSVIYGLYRGFINGVLSVAALIGSAVLSFALCGDLAAWLQQNKTLVDTLMYYTDAGSRISNLDLSLLPVSQVTESALSQILQNANLPSAFELAFVGSFSSAAQSMNIAQLLSQTIVSVSLTKLTGTTASTIGTIAKKMNTSITPRSRPNKPPARESRWRSTGSSNT